MPTSATLVRGVRRHSRNRRPKTVDRSPQRHGGTEKPNFFPRIHADERGSEMTTDRSVRDWFWVENFMRQLGISNFPGQTRSPLRFLRVNRRESVEKKFGFSVPPCLRGEKSFFLTSPQSFPLLHRMYTELSLRPLAPNSSAVQSKKRVNDESRR
jgi:hypothetical protein